MNRRTLLVLIPALVLLGNAVAYLAISKRRPAELPPAAPVVSAPATPAPLPPAPAPPAPREDAEQSAEAAALARRAAGLVALEAGDYDKALIQFTEAQALVGDKARVADLIRVTQDLRSKPPKPQPAPRARASAVASRGVRSARRSEPRDEPAPVLGEPEPATPPATGTLIVTTTPRGLLVQVDDASVDLTPMRTRLKTGTHKVALLDGTRRVYETSVELKEGATATLLKDFSSELAGDPKGAAPAAVTSHDAVREPAHPSTAEAPAERVAAAKAPPPAAANPSALRAGAVESAPAKATHGTGALDISSPGLYGVVWINGRPRGYPPLKVQDVPAGPAKVEIRVNGVQKRSSSVMVQAGGTQVVELVARP